MNVTAKPQCQTQHSNIEPQQHSSDASGLYARSVVVERRLGFSSKSWPRRRSHRNPCSAPQLLREKVGFIEREKVGFIENTAMRHRWGG